MSELIPHLETIATALELLVFLKIGQLFLLVFKSSNVTVTNEEPKDSWSVSYAKAQKLEAETALIREQKNELLRKKIQEGGE